MRTSKCYFLAAMCGMLLVTSVASAQPGGRGRGFGGPDMGAMGLLFDENVRKELEIVDEQIEQYRELTREMFSMFRNRDLSQEERQEKIAAIRGKMDNVLLPHQKERMEQIRVQSRMRRSGTSGALSGDLGETLGISDEQKEKLAKISEEVNKELQEEVAKLRKEAQEKILGVLTAKQKKQLEELMGEPFEFQQRSFGRQGGDGRGGDGRGRGRGRGGDRDGSDGEDN